jgi:hypothetical protein
MALIGGSLAGPRDDRRVAPDSERTTPRLKAETFVPTTDLLLFDLFLCRQDICPRDADD